MPRVEFILHKGVRILDLDIRGSKDIDQNIAAFRLAQELAIKEPLKSLRLLTDVTESHFTTEAVSVLKEFSKSTTPYMKASAGGGHRRQVDNHPVPAQTDRPGHQIIRYPGECQRMAGRAVSNIN